MRGWVGGMKTMPWHQNTEIQKNYTKTSCWLGALFGILFYAKDITGYTGSTRYKRVCVCVFSLDSTAFNSCLHCFFSFPFLTFLLFSVFICQELKTVHTRRLPKKRRKYPKSILNPQTAKPPHHVSEANIEVIHEQTQYDKGANDWDKDDMKDE